MEAQLKPLQLDAISGDGRTLTVPDPERIVRFIIRTLGNPMGGEITFECRPMEAPVTGTGTVQIPVWREMKTVPVPTDISTVTEYSAGKASGMFRARISTPVMGGTATVYPFVGVLPGNANTALEPVVR